MVYTPPSKSLDTNSKLKNNQAVPFSFILVSFSFPAPPFYSLNLPNGFIGTIFTHVSREANKLADYMARKTIIEDFKYLRGDALDPSAVLIIHADVYGIGFHRHF